MSTNKKPVLGKIQGLAALLQNAETAASGQNKDNDSTPGENKDEAKNEELNSAGGPGEPTVTLTKSELNEVVEKKSEARVQRAKETLTKKKKTGDRMPIQVDAGLHKKMKIKLVSWDISFQDLNDAMYELILEDPELVKRIKQRINNIEGSETE